jgi:hypothetical protein
MAGRPARHEPTKPEHTKETVMKVSVLAQAAKTARIAWAILTSGESYKRPVAAAA